MKQRNNQNILSFADPSRRMEKTIRKREREKRKNESYVETPGTGARSVEKR